MPLSVARAKDRDAMASQLEALAVSLGAEVSRGEFHGEREIVVSIRAARGLCLNVDFDGDSSQQRGGIWVLSWHMSTDTDARLADSFGGDVNPHHYRKATYIARGFEGLFGVLGMVELGLCKARDGDAFSAERERRMIEKSGETAAQASERWAKYREDFAAECAAKSATEAA